MDRPAKLVALAAMLFSVNASAYYSNLSPPAGWSPGVGPGGQYAAAAGRAISGARASANFTGRLVDVPVGLRYAATAGRFAARALARSPYAIGLSGLAWLAAECIAVRAGRFVRTCGPDLEPEPEPSTGLEYYTAFGTLMYTSALKACQGDGPLWAAQNGIPLTDFRVVDGMCRATVNRPGGNPDYGFTTWGSRPSDCPAGWYKTSAGCVQTPPPTQPKELSPLEVEEIMEPKRIPDRLPPEIPGVPLPVEVPTINPRPGTDTPAPLRIPQGDPVKVPNSNPERWTQPEIIITPVPSPQNPWRVDVKPVDKPVDAPSDDPDAPKPDRDPYTPEPKPPPNPNPEPGDPEPEPEPKPDEEKTPDVCEKYPDILACQVVDMGELEPIELKDKEIPLELKKEEGFPTGGQCPAAKVLPLMGKSFSFTMQPICDFATMIRPLLIGFAWLTAALTFLGIARRE